MQTDSQYFPPAPRARVLPLLICVASLLLVFSAPLRAAAGVEFDRIGFYEAGEDGNERAPQDWDDPRLQNSFERDRTRYVFTMISLKNLRWQLADQNVLIHLRYYHSDGRLFGDPVIDYEVSQDWEFAELWNGWGWPEAGTWEPDRYRVELWLDNRKRIGSGYFTIH